MKQSLKFLIIGTTFFSLSTFSMGRESGGGNGFHNTPDQVNAEIQHLDIIQILKQVRIGLTDQAILPIEDARAKLILTRIMALKNVVDCSVESIASGHCNSVLSTPHSPMHVLMNGACKENGQERDASVSFHQDKNGQPTIDELCMSAERLAVYTPDTLISQSIALIVHEYSHVAGFPEPDAIFIQDYVINRLLKNCVLGLLIDNRDSGMDDTYTITISGGYKATVTHTRKFEDAANSSLVLNTYNFGDAASSFKLSWSNDGGSMSFNSLNVDGTKSPSQVSWGPMHSLGSDLVTSETISNASLNFNGKPLKIDLVSVAPAACQR